MLELTIPYLVTGFALWCAVNVALSAVEVARELYAIRPARRRAATAAPAVTVPPTPRPRAVAPLRQAA